MRFCFWVCFPFVFFWIGGFIFWTHVLFLVFCMGVGLLGRGVHVDSSTLGGWTSRGCPTLRWVNAE
jgi:hypothetical protein